VYSDIQLRLKSVSFSNYIKADNSGTASKSELYFTDLSGCTMSLLDDLTKEDQEDNEECFQYLYKSAQRNLRIDIQRKLAGRFHIDKKLVTRETSEIKAEFNTRTGLAGVKIYSPLPKYGRIQVLTLSIFCDNVSPLTGTINIYQDDAEGELLFTASGTFEAGRNTIEVYKDFEVDTLFIVFDPETIPLRETRNRYYEYDSVLGDKLCYQCYGNESSVTQINGGGINAKFVVYCSIEKFILENLPIFQFALFYRLGVDAMKERITTQRVNLTSLLTAERAIELLGVFNEDYKAALEAATQSINITEDPTCFLCKSTVQSKTNLP